jgi:pimeloyl-ACP methyl ester carboxylesterase
MKLLRRTLVVLAGLLLTGSACRAQDFGFVWSEWERSAVERRGPERAEGLLLYFHGFGVQHAYLHPIPPIFTEMAKVAAWDVMRINRLPIADSEAQDDDILGLVAKRIAEGRRNGYKKIIVAGYSRGGWLALLAATLPDVNAAIGLAPGTGSYEQVEMERTRDVLAQKLAGARAKYVAAFFFEGDPGEDLSERRAVAVRHGLQKMADRRSWSSIARRICMVMERAARGGSSEDIGIASCSWFRAPINRPAKFNAPDPAAMRPARISAFPRRPLC